MQRFRTCLASLSEKRNSEFTRDAFFACANTTKSINNYDKERNIYA